MRQSRDKENRDMQGRTGGVRSRGPRAAPLCLGGREEGDKERIECLV